MDLVQLTRKASQLYSLPDICFRLRKAIDDPTSELDDIAELISLDPALTARLLRLANSSFYNFPAQVDRVSKAVSLIGTNELYNLALAAYSAATFKDVPSDVINMQRFWRHSVHTGIVCRNLASRLSLKNIEHFFVLGLLHNLGELIVAQFLPEELNKVLTDRPAERAPWDHEQSVLDFTFAICGAELLEHWHMPESISDAVLFQHYPDEAAIDTVGTSLLHFASRIVSMHESEDDFDYLSSIDEKILQQFKLTVDDLQEEFSNAAETTIEVLAAMVGSTVHK